MLGKYNKEWHDNAIIFLCIFTMIMSLYSVFNLSGFFVADFFKNTIIQKVLFSDNMFTNLFDSSIGLFIALFFALKIVLAMGIMSVKSNSKRMWIMMVLFIFYTTEGVLSIGGDCVANDGSIYACGFDHVINPWASLIMMTFFIIIMIKQIIIEIKAVNDLDDVKIDNK